MERVAQVAHFGRSAVSIRASARTNRNREAPRDCALPEGNKRRDFRRIVPPALQRIEPRITAGSIIQVLPPPYVSEPVTKNGNDPNGVCQGDVGFANLYVVGDGGSSSAQTGFSTLYVPVSDSPVGNFRPFVQTYTEWHDQSAGAPAHTTATLTVTVLDVGSLLPPYIPGYPGHFMWQRELFQDSTSWGEQHDSPNPHWSYAGPIQVQFPLHPANLYLLFVEIGATADDDYGSVFGASEASVTAAMQVPFMVVE